MKALHIVGRFLYNHSGEILAGIASIGVVVTAIETGKAMTKAEKILEEAKYEYVTEEGDFTDFTFSEKAQLTWKSYIRPALAGIVTIGCIWAGEGLSAKKQIAIASMYAIAQNKINEYQNYIRENNPENAAEINNDIAKKAALHDLEDAKPVPKRLAKKCTDGSFLVYEPYSEQYFMTNEKEILNAQLAVNKELANEMFVEFNYYLKQFKNAKPYPEGVNIGWSTDSDAWCWNWSFYPGSPWIDITVIPADDTPMKIAALAYGMSPDYIGWDEE